MTCSDYTNNFQCVTENNNNGEILCDGSGRVIELYGAFVVGPCCSPLICTVQVFVGLVDLDNSPECRRQPLTLAKAVLYRVMKMHSIDGIVILYCPALSPTTISKDHFPTRLVS